MGERRPRVEALVLPSEWIEPSSKLDSSLSRTEKGVPVTIIRSKEEAREMTRRLDDSAAAPALHTPSMRPVDGGSPLLRSLVLNDVSAITPNPQPQETPHRTSSLRHATLSAQWGPILRDPSQDIHRVCSVTETRSYQRMLKVRRTFISTEYYRMVLVWCFIFLIVFTLFYPEWRTGHFCCSPHDQEAIQLGIIYIRVPYPESREFQYPSSLMSLYDPPDGFRYWIRPSSFAIKNGTVGLDWVTDKIDAIVSKSGLLLLTTCIGLLGQVPFTLMPCFARSSFFAVACGTGCVIQLAGFLIYFINLRSDENATGLVLGATSEWGVCPIIYLVGVGGIVLVTAYVSVMLCVFPEAFVREPADVMAVYCCCCLPSSKSEDDVPTAVGRTPTTEPLLPSPH